jgi:acetyl-CoA acetyltransferase
MTIRGEAAVVGIGELPIQEFYPGRTQVGLCAEAARMAIADAGLTKDVIDGLLVSNNVSPSQTAEYMGIRPVYMSGIDNAGASGASGVTIAAAVIKAGYANYVLVVMGQDRQPVTGRRPGGGAGAASIGSEFDQPYGLGAGAGTTYAMIYQRHIYEFGTKPEQFAKMAVNQRFNSLTNPNSVFKGQMITVEDVMNSRYIEAPLRLLESVMPCGGAAACIVTSAERAKALPHRTVYLLGAGMEQGSATLWQQPRITTTPTLVAARRAFAMAGYSPRDMQFAEFYD